MGGSGEARLQVLALEPWLGGSHASFLESWSAHSRHELRTLGLAPRSWKWRMRAGAWELARAAARAFEEPPAALFVSDYVDLPSLYGHLPPSWSTVPALLYFHENQLTYPLRPGAAARERDLHYGYTNVSSCLRAAAVAFNSRFHLDEFRAAARALLRRLPRPNPAAELERALDAAAVVHPGVALEEVALGPGAPADAPLRVVFPHRCEHDKDPLAILDAAREALRGGARLELVLLGERYEERPPGVAERLDELAPAVLHEGHLPARGDYLEALGRCDLVASTARHEFFGLATVEALAAGCTPLLPRRLSYPELLEGAADCLYEAPAELPARLRAHAREPAALRRPERRRARRALAERFDAARSAGALDELCARIAAESPRRGPTAGAPVR